MVNPMPTAALKACEFPGCGNTSDRRWCEIHRKGRKTGSYEARRDTAPYGSDWPKLRAIIIARDRHCQWPGCRDPIEEVDHIIPKAEGGTDEHNNLQGLCFRHHTIKTLVEKRTDPAKRGKRYVVNGPPCSGKSYYVRANREVLDYRKHGLGDLVYDYDEICAALQLTNPHHVSDQGHKIAMRTRDAFIEYLLENPEVNGWLITCCPDFDLVTRTARTIRAIEVYPEADKATCYARLRESIRPEWRKEKQRWSIAEWFA